ncbi:Aromatic/aminoadipate aminotransferase 1 [Coccidioides posadasii str. Silveira]|uniref:aromatic-amino-acid transaminase n=2 Tax=Coccidioides posadasii TaxID=199306 RepID=A0A0J6IEG0_COCPO|nr:aminotransferase, classes I and II family protein [Coccidioides posadasii C735 delta SOWgp]EER29497.1 aminotransferase, classes I and II family protein [Coccidioides posadasii C735 delta SOWgp]KMM70122.1 aromatic amino acid aminotransferase 1 [Coccidioides posadasii RMSCC 3488]QVM09288.1 Aromatic/aminoadipate aminotransferase 1 [Coccidioides posadasii str. Silveira]|eukprot:XP_003071642.1 aminotransferase, classes I and II family protein [Coccidioides posadasii C735 delta SOWgp]
MSPHAAQDAAAQGAVDITKEMPEPLTVANVPARRAKTTMPTGVAASCHSDMFKSLACATKPKAKRWDKYLSIESKSRKASTLKQAAEYLKNPGLISLGGGLPSPEYFPIDEISIKVPVAPNFSEEATHESGQVVTAGKYDIREGRSEYDLEIALNYGQSVGAAQLLRFVTEHTEIVHNPPYSDWHCSLTAASTASWDMVLRLFCNRGDYILTEEFTFSSAMETALPQGIRLAPVKMDEQGLLPSSLDEVLTNWDASARGARKPFVLYTVPSGQNPTGATQDVERRKEVYKVAQKHDIIIVEDEPYYFLQMQPYKGANAPQDPPPANYNEFLKALIPSFLSMDVDGRVVRLESFSKVLSPGSRVGWLVASEQIVERFLRNAETCTQNPSGMSQIILFKLLDEAWGHEKYLQWLVHIRMAYTNRRNVMLEACEKYLPTSVASWHPPAAGMFHWIKVDWKKHPLALAGDSYDSIEEAIFKAAVGEGVLVSRGSWFFADKSTEPTDMFFRATFAAAPADKIQQAIKRFGDTLRAQFQLQ